MATTALAYPTAAGNPVSDTLLASWLAMKAGDVGAPLKVGEFEQRATIHSQGVIGAAGSVILRGSNLPNPDPAVPANWFPMKDAFNAAVTATALPAYQEISANPLWLSPIAAGDGTTAIDVYFLTKKTS